MFKSFQQSPLFLYGHAQAAYARIKQIQDDFEREGVIQNCQLLGVSGLGKSTLAKAYAAEHPHVWEADSRVMRVVYFKVPPNPTQKSVFSGLAEAFGGPSSGNANDLLRRVVKYANKCRCVILFVDEAHHFLDRGQARSHAQAADYWKVFHDEFPGVIVFVGAPRFRSMLRANTQWANRAGEEILLRPMSYDDYERDLLGFINLAIQGTPLAPHLTFFQNSDTLARVQYATDGVPVHIVTLIDRVRRGVSNGEQLTLELFDQVWNFLPGCARLRTERRPFHRSFDWERLCAFDEPFAPSTLDGDNHGSMEASGRR